MTRFVPYQELFDDANKFSKVQNYVLIGSTAATIASITLNTINASPDFPYRDCLITSANVLASLFAVAFVVFEILINEKFYAGSTAKRVDLIDHAFGTNFAGQQTVGYFNPGGVAPGIYKLAVLGFENSLFSSTVAKKMTFNKWIVASMILIIFVISAAIGNKDWVNNLLQLAATAIIVQQAIKLQLFANRMKAIHSDFKTLFNDLKDLRDKSSKEGEVAKNVLNYECTLAWGNILLDSKLFFSVNPTLSVTWEQMKQSYNI